MAEFQAWTRMRDAAVGVDAVRNAELTGFSGGSEVPWALGSAGAR